MLSYSQTLDYIFNLRGGEIDLRLHRVERVLSLFGHPERGYPAFHIAGTNGKGSVAAMLHRILAAEGYRVALFPLPTLSLSPSASGWEIRRSLRKKWWNWRRKLSAGRQKRVLD